MKTKLLLSALFLAFLGIANSASAQDSTKWDKNHPRRAEVNSRLKNQNERIDKKEADGKMGVKEADKLHKEDHAIRKEERKDENERTPSLLCQTLHQRLLYLSSCEHCIT